MQCAHHAFSDVAGIFACSFYKAHTHIHIKKYKVRSLRQLLLVHFQGFLVGLCSRGGDIRMVLVSDGRAKQMLFMVRRNKGSNLLELHIAGAGQGGDHL